MTADVGADVGRPELALLPGKYFVRAHALDRVLQYGYYVIPNFHSPAFWVAYWDKFRRPKIAPKYGLGFDTWWIDPQAEKAIATKQGGTKP